MVGKDKVEVRHSEQKPVSKEYKPHVLYPNATKKDHTNEQFGNDTITLQSRDSAKISSDRDDITSSIDVNDLVAQHSLQETPQKIVIEPRSSSASKTEQFMKNEGFKSMN
ncbi:hypothetical protein GOBAR_AA17894 [Gossypium barbadense]|uniref:Uncharacterized protein n=1 Tax=Gossypium barbadense TaxID=3634 RepID=A0A2P5XHD0_GOSBA|nr:hypothetical protein GOBAR_AA17894 [Gossypium barbadense]